MPGEPRTTLGAARVGVGHGGAFERSARASAMTRAMYCLLLAADLPAAAPAVRVDAQNSSCEGSRQSRPHHEHPRAARAPRAARTALERYEKGWWTACMCVGMHACGRPLLVRAQGLTCSVPVRASCISRTPLRRRTV
jgi:hypothetical protein